MGQILHGSAKTTHAVRAAIQRSKASIQELASRYDLNPKTVMKWRKRAFLYDAPMGPKVPRSTVLSAEEEALAVAFRTAKGPDFLPHWQTDEFTFAVTQSVTRRLRRKGNWSQSYPR